KKQLLDRFGIPETALAYMDYRATFDASAATAALQGSGVSCPPLRDYAWRIWDYWERHLDPDLPNPRNLRRVLNDRVVVITGASSGIGHAVAQRVAAAGAQAVAVARSLDKLEALKADVEQAGGRCASYPPRFAAYVASKAALDAFSLCLAPEITADGVAITEIHMPLVRTPMIAPTSIYKYFPTISPEEAAEMVTQAMITRPHEVSTRL